MHMCMSTVMVSEYSWDTASSDPEGKMCSFQANQIYDLYGHASICLVACIDL